MNFSRQCISVFNGKRSKVTPEKVERRLGPTETVFVHVDLKCTELTLFPKQKEAA